MCPDILVHGTRFCYVSDVGPLSAPPPQTSPEGMSALYITIVGPPHVRFPMSALCRPLEYIFPWKAYVCSVQRLTLEQTTAWGSI